jgi:chromosome segregation ATPase
MTANDAIARDILQQHVHDAKKVSADLCADNKKAQATARDILQKHVHDAERMRADMCAEHNNAQDILQQELQRKADEVCRLKTTTASNERKMRDVSSAQAAANNECEQLRANHEKAQRSLQEVRRELQTETQRLKNQLSSVEAERNSAADHLKAALSNSNAAELMNKRLVCEHERREADLQSELRILKNEVRSAQEALDDMKIKMSAAVEAKAKELAATQRELADLNEAHNEICRKVDEVRITEQGTSNDLGRLRSQLATTQETVATKNDELQRVEGKLRVLQKRCDDNALDHQRESDERTRLERQHQLVVMKKVADLEQQVESSASLMVDLKAAVTDAQHSQHTAERKCQAECQVLLAAEKTAHGKAHHFEQQYRALEQDVSTLQQEHWEREEGSADQISQLQKNIHRLEDEMQLRDAHNLRAITSKDEKINDYQSKLAHLKPEVIESEDEPPKRPSWSEMLTQKLVPFKAALPCQGGGVKETGAQFAKQSTTNKLQYSGLNGSCTAQRHDDLDIDTSTIVCRQQPRARMPLGAR